jgi:hypothetical protein
MCALGDRRIRARMEVMGTLRGTLDTPAAVRLVNVSLTGALLESPLALPVDSIQVVHFNVDGNDVPVESLVRHVRDTRADSTSKYLVGIEFISAPLALLRNLDQFIADSGSGV